MSDFYIYAHVRPDKNEVFYVGKGKGNRAYEKGCRRNQYWNRVVSKNGGKFIVLKLAENLLESLAFDLEIALIAKFRQQGVILCNMTDGGEGTSGWKPSAETRQKRSKAMMGENNPSFGKKASAESRKRQGEAQKGKKASAEARKKQSEAKKGEKNSNFGNTGIKSIFSKPVQKIDRETNQVLEIFPGLCEAERKTGIYQSSISKVCNGKLKSAGGYIWRFDIIS